MLGLSAFESDLQFPDGSHVRRLGHQQTPKTRFTTQCPWTSPNRMRLVEATQHKCRGRSAKTSPNRDWKPRAGAPGCEERHRSYQLSRKHFQKVPIVGIPHALDIIAVLTRRRPLQCPRPPQTPFLKQPAYGTSPSICSTSWETRKANCTCAPRCYASQRRATWRAGLRLRNATGCPKRWCPRSGLTLLRRLATHRVGLEAALRKNWRPRRAPCV